jgi:nucleotide-binding universal stress UspA family protein
MYDRILLATEGTEASTDATTHAIELAAETGATLHVLFVVDETVYSAYSGDEYVDEAEGPERGLEEIGEEAIDAIRDRATSAGVEVESAMRHGVPAQSIVEYADDADVDLLVLGTKHRPAEHRALLGSVTDRVLRLTARPATVIKTTVEE